LKIEKNVLEDLIKSQIIIYCDENDIDLVELTNKTRLIGSQAIFDSMGLVTFLVELEEKIEEKFSIVIEIADEKAMSRVKSPFMNIESLLEFLIEKINEA
jgi:acyl carrier protein